eukprot:8810270-Pyramimonas_sp.AAC.1
MSQWRVWEATRTAPQRPGPTCPVRGPDHPVTAAAEECGARAQCNWNCPFRIDIYGLCLDNPRYAK